MTELENYIHTFFGVQQNDVSQIVTCELYIIDFVTFKILTLHNGIKRHYRIQIITVNKTKTS